jgi:hypothetical protein
VCGSLIYSFTRGQIGGIISPMPAQTRPTKITLADMRDMGVRGLLIYCSDYKCSHSIAISADKWPEEVRLSDLETRFVSSEATSRAAQDGARRVLASNRHKEKTLASPNLVLAPARSRTSRHEELP